MAVSRRDFLKAVGGLSAAAALPGCPDGAADAGLRAEVAILPAAYDAALPATIEAALQLAPPPDVQGKRVLLKINLVDLPRDDRPAVTHPAMVVAAAEAFRRRGAAEVHIADGPGLQRDAWQIADAIGLSPLLDAHALPFIDLNTSDLVRVPNGLGRTGLEHLYFASTVWQADMVVSVAKVKTHHWLGASLSAKNMFGTLSGQAYGVPRNLLHLRDPNLAVLDILHTRPPDYALLDGVIAMEGDGPVRGDAVALGVIVAGANALAVDATGCRLMGLRPERIGYLAEADQVLGPLAEAFIAQRGEPIGRYRRSFRVLPHQSLLTF